VLARQRAKPSKIKARSGQTVPIKLCQVMLHSHTS